MNLLVLVSNQKREILPNNVANVFGITLGELAYVIGVSDETFANASSLSNFSVQSKLRNLMEIVMLVSTWAGGTLQAFTWYRNAHLPALGNITAETAVKMGHADYVFDFIRSVSLRGYA